MSHNWKMILGLVLVFVVGGLQAIKGLTWTNGIETLLPILLFAEHYINGAK